MGISLSSYQKIQCVNYMFIVMLSVYTPQIEIAALAPHPILFGLTSKCILFKKAKCAFLFEINLVHVKTNMQIYGAEDACSLPYYRCSLH